jgi:large subunit ribosomal protein L21
MEQTTMYAVFRSGGKQYRASKGERIRLEKLDADEGANVKFDEVLLIGEGAKITVGSPLLSGGSVSAKVLQQGKSKKVDVVKFKRRANYKRQHTHRQFFTEVEIISISGSGSKAPEAEKASEKPAAQTPAAQTPAAQTPAAQKAAAKKPAAKKTVAAKKPVAKKAVAAKKPAAKKPAGKKATKKKGS